MKDALGDRMKQHEAVTRAVLPSRTYTVLRVDGKAFHSYTRGLERPYDATLMADMNAVAEALCSEIGGSVFAYTQSDEISVLAQDFASNGTQAWMGGVNAKWTSVSASLATAVLNERRPGKRALFDARVFTLPSAVEVANYFLWRQKDAVRNSVSMAAQSFFSHKDLQGKSSGEMQEMLWSVHGVNWNNYPAECKRGRVTFKESGEREFTFTHKRTGVEETATAVRSWWTTEAAPHFVVASDNWLSQQIPAAPSLLLPSGE